MSFIEMFTLKRAWSDLGEDEFFWEPAPGSWGVRRRGDCVTPTPFGDGDWVTDFDLDLVLAALSGTAIEPLTTIGWLLWHIGSQPGRLAELDLFSGTRTPGSGWTSPYLTHHPVFSNAAEAVESMRAGWEALRAALETTSDDQLERRTHMYSYGAGPPGNGVLASGDGPGPETTGTAIVIGVLNEVSHHGSQICVLRDLHRIRA